VSDPGVDWPAAIAGVLGGHGLRVAFQPIVDLARLEVAGYEALARFDGPLGGRPDLWFAAARDLGLADQLDAAVVAAALARRDDLPPNRFMTLNLEPGSLGTAVVDRVLSRSSLDGLVLELTEHAPIDSYAELLPLLDRYRSRGALIAVDDAGSGYAGLQHILAIRPAFLKVDKALVEGVHLDGAKAALVEMLGTFASRIDAWVIAEGVEVEEEAHTLTRLGVPLVQGFLFARPVPGWGEVDAHARTRLVGRRRAETGDTLRPLLDVVPWVYDDDTGAATRLLASGRAGLVVVLDHRGRPLGTLDAAGAVVGRLQPANRVAVGTPPVDLARRIGTRPPDDRLLPTVCCDSAGRYVGIVTASRLLEHLAQRP
jgi:EAL domain-containing protein (putative c-di-GMP-specific phosphodiesterase class I)